jgi:signal transduction histidine kinase
MERFMDISRFLSRTLPALCAGFFFLAAGAAFIVKYAGPGAVLPLFFDVRKETNRVLFYVNFWVPWFLSALSLYGCFFLSGGSGEASVSSPTETIRAGAGFVLRGFLLVISLTLVIIAGYVLDDTLTVRLCLYGAFTLLAAVSFSPPRGFCAVLGASFLFGFLSFHPKLFGAALGTLAFSTPGFGETLLLLLYLGILAALSFSIRVLSGKYAKSEAMISHLNLVGTQMLLFNHRLQEYVKNSGEEAVKKDRLRFTSDLHDSCGYVFANIIALSNAAMSQEDMEGEKARETLHMILNQAQEGLKRTREILHMIREIREPASKGIDTIYQMKNIFEEVTGITVEIETGNMRYDYGPTVNSVLSRVVQESFTNAVRHGKASRIGIQFWEFPQSLSMTVSDNGKGARQIVKGIGLAGMEERLREIGGTFEAYSPEDGGFRLSVEIPLVTVSRQNGESA